MEPHLQKWLRKLPRRYKKYRQPKELWSMTIPNELAFCESYARECFSGTGRMVDLGCWLGATTFSLARGLSRNRRAKINRLIEAFDLFVWNKWMRRPADAIQMPIKYRDGESFFPDVQKLLEPFGDIVRLRQEDLMEHRPANEPVELLFIDAFKSWPLAEKIVRDFFPLLVPGVSVVVQQDFIFHKPIAATNHLLMWRLQEHFEWLHQIPRSGSVVFLCKKRVDRAALPALDVDSFSLAEINEAYEYSRACVVEDDRRTHVEATKLLFLIERGEYDAALEHARWLIEHGIKLRDFVVADASSLINQTRAKLLKQRSDAASEVTAARLAKIATLLPNL